MRTRGGIAFAAQHLTEFGIGGWWDEAGDVFEDVMFAGVLAYTIWLGVSRRASAAGPPELANRVVVLMLLSVPGLVYDLFLRPDDGWPFFPLWYGATSVVMTLSLLRRPVPGSIPAGWRLSDREEEVVRLVQRGLSNKAIARELEISPNTVKTHLRSAFDKSGIRTRTGLMAALSAPVDAADHRASHQEG